MPGGGDGEPQARGELGPLPGGLHGLSREQVAESQRERLLAAVATLVAERGYRPTTISEIAKTAAVANRVFYANFTDKEAAYLAAFDAVADHLTELIGAAVAAEPDWPHRLTAALRTALEFFDANRDVARLCLIVPFAATPGIAGRFRETIDGLIPLFAAGRNERPDGSNLPESTEDSLLGGVIVQISRSIRDESEPLPDRLPDLVEFVLSPYLGPDRASRLAAESVAHTRE